LLFLDEIVRNLSSQATVALTKASERYSAADVALIKRILITAFPTRRPLFDSLCTVLDANVSDLNSRIVAFRRADEIMQREARHGGFSILFCGSASGYYIYRHRIGFVAVLAKKRVHLAYRDLDPVDIVPYLLFGKTEEMVRRKITSALSEQNAQIIWNYLEYVRVQLQRDEEITVKFPRLQAKLLANAASAGRNAQNRLRRFDRALNRPWLLKSKLRKVKFFIEELLVGRLKA
jgi:hypothetical protein